ncbi:uncharacterized protein LOC111449743 isoform X1 [Cucurbita moschata]|uniref:Uncharacterized protein LOC111449743 isoform X1 n=1 Tax=Cucurbita moschata TaxID=3662 RepID=A0A6J1G176_CUCMO|nr:uncharacterized protein LOC111449743 isoform X1 [Cucurbita moschata]
MAERPNKTAAAGIGVRKLKIFPHASSLASVESLSLPLVSAFSLYLRRFSSSPAEINALWSVILQVQEIVFAADIGCAECQKKLANILAKMNDTESVVVNLLDKKVILTRKLQIQTSRVSTIKRLLGSSF